MDTRLLVRSVNAGSVLIIMSKFYHSFQQVVFGPHRCEGIGLSDGEVMERLWSYLRRFSRMTKEMRPAHRIDILSHALTYYGIKTKHKLGNLSYSSSYKYYTNNTFLQ